MFYPTNSVISRLFINQKNTIMKKIIFLPFLFFFIASIAQEKFVVPEQTDIQKQWRLTSQMNVLVINSINYAKSVGQTVEELATFTGNQFKTSWNKENGWEGFAKGCLRNWLMFRPDNQIEILEQSETMLKFKSKIPYARLKTDGPFYNVSHDEYMTFLKISHKTIGNYLGASISFENVDKGIIVTIKKK